MKTLFPANSSSSRTGFTRLDLLAVVGVLAVIALAAVPALATNRSLSQRTTCFGNLRQIGAAFLTWAGEHNDNMPVRTMVPEGTQVPGKSGNAYEEFFFIRNELGSPNVLACPADEKTLPARGWFGPGRSVQRLRDRAMSYFVGLEASVTLPDTFLSGDHHMTTEGPSACSSGINNASGISLNPGNPPVWTNAVHGPTGNLLLNDGSVHQLSVRGLAQKTADLANDDSVFHILQPIK